MVCVVGRKAIPLLHQLQVLGHSESRVRLGLDLLNLNAGRNLGERQGALLSVHLEDTLRRARYQHGCTLQE